MSNKELVLNFFEAWNNDKKDRLNLAAEMQHISPMATFTDRDTFLTHCFGKFKVDMTVRDIIAEGNKVCIWYDASVPEGDARPICEWFTIKDGLITEIRVFY